MEEEVVIESLLMDKGYRKGIIQYIKGQENVDRKEKSMAETDIYSGDIEPYVMKKFEGKYDAATLSEIPIVSTINIAEKVVNTTASIYKTAPVRTFQEVSEDQEGTLELVYNDLWFDTKMLAANRYFKLQKQNSRDDYT